LLFIKLTDLLLQEEKKTNFTHLYLNIYIFRIRYPFLGLFVFTALLPFPLEFRKYDSDSNMCKFESMLLILALKDS